MKLFNSTLVSLVASHYLHSPLLIKPFYYTPTEISIQKSFFSKFSTNLFFSRSPIRKFHLKGSFITNFTKTSIYILDDECSSYKRDERNGVTTNCNVRSSTVAIEECVYRDCTTDGSGGALFVAIGGNLTVNYTSFDNCYTTGDNIGGAMFIMANNTYFIGSCARNVKSMNGSLFASPSVTNCLDFNYTTVTDIIEKVDSVNDCVFYVLSKQLNMHNSNISNSKATSYIIRSNPSHSIEFTNNWFYQNTVENAMFYFLRLNSDMAFNFIYSISCTSSSKPYFELTGGAVFRYFYFKDCSFSALYSIAGDSQRSPNVTLMDSSFSGSAFSASPSYYTQNVTENSVDELDYSHIPTQTCWQHSMYVWERPSAERTFIFIGIVIALSVLLIITLALHKIFVFNKKYKNEDQDYTRDNLPAVYTYED